MAHLRNGDPAPGWRPASRSASPPRCATSKKQPPCSARPPATWTSPWSVRPLAYAILDGTLIPIDRVADQKPYYGGKRQRHGVNVQVIADPADRLVWASPALPGSAHDLTAARARA
jgi:hypothetical protein